MTFAWEDAWQRGATPWDRGSVAPGLAWWLGQHAEALLPRRLEDVPQSGSLATPRVPHACDTRTTQGRALVPGAGHGHDVLALAHAGWDVTAVDIAPTAVVACAQRIATAGINVQARVICADFFESPPKAEALQEPFDLLFDYTFCCALPPALRAAWAQTCATRIKQGGRLLHLAFPLDERQRSAATLQSLSALVGTGRVPVDPGAGPPFVLDLHELATRLMPYFVLEDVAVEVPSAPDRRGREALLLWRRR